MAYYVYIKYLLSQLWEIISQYVYSPITFYNIAQKDQPSDNN